MHVRAHTRINTHLQRGSAQCHGPTSPPNVAVDRPGLPDISPCVFFFFFIAEDFVRCLSQGLKGSVPLSERGIYRERQMERKGGRRDGGGGGSAGELKRKHKMMK